MENENSVTINVNFLENSAQCSRFWRIVWRCVSIAVIVVLVIIGLRGLIQLVPDDIDSTVSTPDPSNTTTTQNPAPPTSSTTTTTTTEPNTTATEPNTTATEPNIETTDVNDIWNPIFAKGVDFGFDTSIETPYPCPAKELIENQGDCNCSTNIGTPDSSPATEMITNRADCGTAMVTQNISPANNSSKPTVATNTDADDDIWNEI